ncbi:pyrimidine reductase family protein [Diaminobutyricimonas sp. TR449]|uniref:pyrimidine reductase family protein n=1 Tax=Diaminobutyricimonas sp. TR449 TaxID=2708076 RepID=UPI00141D94ED|nr:pyrimidine reductase family protein [Diaminobutyricimonas sp. TR449]
MSEIRRLQGAADVASDDDVLGWYAVADRATPWVRANFVSSADGAATHDGHSEGLGTPADKRVFQLLRWLADVIVVGAGTVRAEGYAGSLLRSRGRDWRVSQGLSPHPVVAIVSAKLDLDPGLGVFTDAPVRPLVFTAESAPLEHRAELASVAEVLDAGASAVDPRLMRAELVARGLPQVHSEGGPHLLGSLIEAGVLDELCLTLSPRLEGGTVRRIVDGGAVVPMRMSLAHALAADDGTLLLRYLREHPAD